MRETSLYFHYYLQLFCFYIPISILVFAFKTCHAAGLPDFDKIYFIYLLISLF